MAARFLEAHGLVVVVRNFHAGRLGEIDLIAKDGKTLVFVEVKYRSTTRSGYPEEAVTPRKQWTICRIAQHYLCMKKAPANTPVRFDVVAIRKADPGEEEKGRFRILWLRDAFPYQGYESIRS